MRGNVLRGRFRVQINRSVTQSESIHPVLQQIARAPSRAGLKGPQKTNGYTIAGYAGRHSTTPSKASPDSREVFKDAIISIMATLAKQERIKRSERTKSGTCQA